MSEVFQIRGVTGSGKTTAMRNLLARYGRPKTFAGKTAHGPELFTRSGRLVAIGDYNSSAKCVGCDRIKGRNHIFDAVDAAINGGVGLVGLESMIFSTTFKMSADLWRHLTDRGHGFRLVFLDCDFATALERIYKRNGGKQVSIEGLEHRVQAYESSRDKCLRAGIPSTRIDATGSAREVLEQLREAIS